MLRIFSALLLALIIMVLIAPAHAGTAPVTEQTIGAQYDRLVKALNDRENPHQTVRTLHEHFSDDAEFRLTVSSAGTQGGKSPVMKMDKQAYINTYIQGTHYISDYRVEIRTLRFEPGENPAEAYTLDLITERGLMPNAFNEGKPFISRTTCRNRHELRADRLVTTAGSCHTDISFEEDI